MSTDRSSSLLSPGASVPVASASAKGEAAPLRIRAEKLAGMSEVLVRKSGRCTCGEESES